VIALAALGAITAARLRQVRTSSAAPVKKEQRPLAVKTVRLAKGPIRAWVYGKGTARAVRREYLVFESQGKVTYVKPGPGNRDLREGDPVRGPKPGKTQGELLAQLDDRDEVEDVKVAQAELKQAEEQLLAAKADLERAKAQLELAESNLRRDQKLQEKSAITPAQFDVTQAKAKEAVAAAKATQAQLNVAASAVAAAEARAKQAEVAQERTKLFAPIDGIIAYLNIKKGYYVTPQSVREDSEEALLTTIPMVVIDPSEYEITMEIPSFDGSLVRPGQAAFILRGEDLTAAALSGGSQATAVERAKVFGQVFSVNPAVNPGGRSIQIKVRTTKGAEAIRDGMFVTCWIIVDEKTDAITVPYNGLIFRDQQTYAFVANTRTGAAERREVRTGIDGFRGTEVLEGLKEGELVVTEGRHRLVTGAAVEVIEEAQQ